MKKVYSILIAVIFLFLLVVPCFAVPTYEIVKEGTSYFNTFDYTYYSQTPENGLFYFLYDGLYVNDLSSVNNTIFKRVSYPNFPVDYTFMVLISSTSGSVGSTITIVKSNEPLYISQEGTLSLAVSTGKAKTATFSYSVDGDILKVSTGASGGNVTSITYATIWGATYDIKDPSGSIVLPGVSGDTPWIDTSGGDGEYSGILGSISSAINKVISSITSLPGKIIDGIISGLKALFIPSDDFFSDYVNEIKEDLEAHNSFIALALSIFAQFLDCFANLSNTEPVLSFPGLEFMGHTLIPAISYNFNSLLENPVLLNLYNVYILCIKGVMGLWLINLLRDKIRSWNL